MKPHQEKGDDAALDKVMGQWVIGTPLPPRFQEQVWQRIARSEAKPEAGMTFWALLRRLVETNLPRPRFAYSYIAILLLLGVASGTWAAQRQSSRLSTDLGSRYVQSVDPYRKAAPDL